MKSLLIDTSSNYITIEIIENDKVLTRYYDVIDNDMSSRIFPIIDSLFKQVAFAIGDIDKIYVINGPGSFTGIRIGVTIAKVIASNLNKKIYPISSLEYMASGSNKRCLSLIDAKRGYVFAGIYDNNLKCIMEDTYIKLEDIDDNLYDEVVSYSFDNIQKPNLNSIKLINKYKENSINPHLVNPNYLKLTEAEERLKEKSND